MRAVIAAGGTAGHVVPALAIADALRERGAEVEFVGGERAEAELVPAAGYPFHRLRVAGIDRRNPLRAARAVGLAALASARAPALLRRVRPDVVLGGGGYVAGPVGLAAGMLGVPLALSEADSHLGLTNRLLAPLARRVFLAFPRHDPGAEGGEDAQRGRYLVVGRPIPRSTLGADRAAARARFGIPADARCLLVFGGSLGARSLNEAAIEAFGPGDGAAAASGTLLAPDGPVAQSAPAPGPAIPWVLHACGRRDHEALAARLEALGAPGHYLLHPYIEPFADALAAADLTAARAGGSIFELAAAGLPAVLVPYPHATADHQATNAEWMARGGAAVVLPDDELDAARLAAEADALLTDPDRLAAMSRSALAIARPDAADRIADELIALARDGRGRRARRRVQGERRGG